jgi:cob(I)alamin adenosyltransferase
MVERGLVQIYTGEGKGKTTAALGLIVRALGQGLRVLLVRLLKPVEPPSGELRFFQGCAGLEILSSGLGILGPAPDRVAVAASVEQAFAVARDKILAGGCDLAVFDELNNALHRHYLPLAAVLQLLDERPAGIEIVLTGRNAPPELIARADLVTSMEAVKHPFNQGIGARRGIEY